MSKDFRLILGQGEGLTELLFDDFAGSNGRISDTLQLFASSG